MTFARNAVALLQQSPDVSFHRLNPTPVVMYRNRSREQDESQVEANRLIIQRPRLITLACRHRHGVVAADRASQPHRLQAWVLPRVTECRGGGDMRRGGSKRKRILSRCAAAR